MSWDFFNRHTQYAKICKQVFPKGVEKGSVIYGSFVNALDLQLADFSFKWNIQIASVMDNFMLGFDFLKSI